MSVGVPRIRQPEYTGENRCIPCTLVNVIIAAAGSAVLTLWSFAFGAATFAVALVIIYFRGYLVPGTPALTKRYLPSSVLRWFGKEPSFVSVDDAVSTDPEKILIDAGVITPCEISPDLCLVPGFETAWRERMRALDGDADEEDLRTAFGASSEQISFVEHGDAVVATNEEGTAGQWPSPAAVMADVTATAEFAQRYSDWGRLSVPEKARVLTSLRVFLEECPKCEGPVRLEQEVVDSCCQSYDVALSSCQKCDAKLFEVEWQDEFASAEPADQTERPASVEV